MDFSNTVFYEPAEDFNEILKHPDRNDVFWRTRYGGGEAHNAVKHANIPVLLVTGFYDIYTGGIFDMWNEMDCETKSKSSLLIHPFDHSCSIESQPIDFEKGNVYLEFENYAVRWLNSIRNLCAPPFERGKVTYYELFGGKWCCDDLGKAKQFQEFNLGRGIISFEYDPNNPATFKGGLSTNFGGAAWQDRPSKRDDIITLYTPEFLEDTFVKGKLSVKLKVMSDCEDTCFYVRISLCKEKGDYGLRDDINQISNFCVNYIPNTFITMNYSFDEHAFIVKKGEKLRIDISSSADPYYVRHTNNRGLFSEQTTTKIALNSINLDHSSIKIPIS